MPKEASANGTLIGETARIMSTTTQTVVGVETSSSPQREPLELKGVLKEFESFDVTPVIGREFANVNLKDWLRAPNSDELLRDLAITSKLNCACSVQNR